MECLIKYVGICGSDILRLDMGQPVRSLGHEIVVQNATGWYALNPLITCGRCKACLSDRTRFCVRLQSFGKDNKGGFHGGLIEPPNSNLLPLETEHPELYVLSDPLACVLHGLSLLPSRITGNILVIGDGVIAELMCRILADRNISVVQVVKRRRVEVDIKNRTYITKDQLPVAQYRMAILCVGGNNSQVINLALSALIPSGTLLVMGAFHTLEAGLDTKSLLTKEIRLLGSYSFEPSDFKSAVQEVSHNEAKYQQYITDIFNSELLEQAIVQHRVSNNRLKVVVKF